MLLVDSQNKILKRRLSMFKRDPYCYWCGCLTVLNAQSHPHQATVDHLYSKWHPLRQEKYKAGSDRTAVLHVLACLECNNARGNDDERGRVFVPKLTERQEMADLCSAAIAGRVPKRAPIPDHVRGFGWTDTNGDLRPRSWEEYCHHHNAFVGNAFYRHPKPRRSAICTLGELLEFRKSATV